MVSGRERALTSPVRQVREQLGGNIAGLCWPVCSRLSPPPRPSFTVATDMYRKNPTLTHLHAVCCNPERLAAPITRELRHFSFQLAIPGDLRPLLHLPAPSTFPSLPLFVPFPHP
jgi:hypothetical protein